MAFNHLLSSILRGPWLIDRTWANAHLPIVMAMLKGESLPMVTAADSTTALNGSIRTGNEGVERPFVIDPLTMTRFELFDYESNKYPPGSIGVLPISGPILKYNVDCGAYGMIYKAGLLEYMDKDENIIAVIILMDTPGGEVRAGSIIETVIDKMKKPVLTFVDGMAASMGIRIAAHTDEIYLSDKFDEIGSIGCLCVFADYSGYFEKEGIKIHEVYAPQSTDKNKDFRDALEGDYTLLTEDLSIHARDFIEKVKEFRGEKAAASAAEWNTGKLFYAPDGIRLGLADGIRSFTEVVSKAAWLGRRNKNSVISKI